MSKNFVVHYETVVGGQGYPCPEDMAGLCSGKALRGGTENQLNMPVRPCTGNEIIGERKER
jgi:hypothetical protein